MMPRNTGGVVIITDAEIYMHHIHVPPLQRNETSMGSEKRIPTALYYTGFKVRKRVEKYFFNTSETVTTVDISTFIKGGIN
jgi:hypothetical protein